MSFNTLKEAGSLYMNHMLLAGQAIRAGANARYFFRGSLGFSAGIVGGAIYGGVSENGSIMSGAVMGGALGAATMRYGWTGAKLGLGEAGKVFRHDLSFAKQHIKRNVNQGYNTFKSLRTGGESFWNSLGGAIDRRTNISMLNYKRYMNKYGLL